MSDESLFGGDPTDTEARIMYATYQVLGRHGYAGLSIGRIADEADLSKSSVYHFYDDKQALLLAFLDVMLERFGEQFSQGFDEDPVTALRNRLTHTATGRPPAAPDVDGEGTVPFGPFIELRAQAVTDPAFHERITELDRLFRTDLAAVIRRGVDDGSFRDVDPERAAEAVLTLLMGLVLRRSTAELDGEQLESELENVLERYLFAAE